jgi:predicted nucleotidyltransferase
MLSAEDRNAILKLARRFGASRVLLFGSAAKSEGESRDIDLAVEGIAPREFFRFYGELMFALSKPVDLIDLAASGRFTGIVRRDGSPLYVRGQ